MLSKKNCESWEEEMYWKNFNFARFTLILPHDFHHRLILPEKFTNHMRTHLPEKVVLKVNGLAWDVDLKKGRNDVMLQGNGWKTFAKAYSLKESNMLVIEYDRHEWFNVLIFDNANSCEKEASYFVRKDQQPSSSNGDDSDEEEFTDRNQRRDDDSGYTLGRRLRRNSSSARKGAYSSGKAAQSDVDDGDEGDETSHEENSISSEDCTTPKKASRKGEQTTAKKKRACVTCYKSNRRQFTEDEKRNALEKAKEACNQRLNSFFVVMRPTSVYKQFILSIPWEWNPPGTVFKNGEIVILKVKEKTWVCRISCRGLQCAGWKRFALQNFLEEYDVCLFVLSGSMDGKPVLDVSIFRVVPQTVPPSPGVNESVSEDSNEKSCSEEDCTPETGATVRGRESLSNISRKRKRDTGETTHKETGTCDKSSARNITEADKERVLKIAEEKSANYKNSFIAVMKTTSVVSRRFFLAITKYWKLRCNMRNGQEVILQLREKTWTCIFYCKEHNVGLQRGWKRFVVDNKLKKFDVCLFVPAQENGEKCILDVHIFRV